MIHEYKEDLWHRMYNVFALKFLFCMIDGEEKAYAKALQVWLYDQRN